MKKQIVRTENHQIKDYHSYHTAHFENGRMVRTETDYIHSIDEVWRHREQQEYQLTPWQKSVTVQEYIEDMSAKGLDPVLESAT